MDYEHRLFEIMDNQPSGIEAQVCQDIATRQKAGIAKYGVTVAENPLKLREWYQHHYEELLDAAIYAKRIIAELDKCEPKPQAPDEIWIPWDASSKHPGALNSSDMVTIKMRDGTKFTDRAGNIHWNWTGNDDDTVSYKLA